MSRKVILVLVLIFLKVSPAAGQELLRKISWRELQQSGKLDASLAVSHDNTTGKDSLLIEGRSGAPTIRTLITVDKPGVTEGAYAIIGEVRYENVEGSGYFEMWNYFPDGGAYFSRTLAPAGPLGVLSGSSSWRPLSIPFFLGEKASDPSYRPHQLVLGIVIPGGGWLEISDLQLQQFSAAAAGNILSVPGAWWPAGSALMVIAVFSLVAVVVIAILAVLISRRSAPVFVLTTLQLLLALGLALLGAAGYGFFTGQPGYVLQPLIIYGMLAFLAAALRFKAIRKKYEEDEFRRMMSVDMPARR